MPLEVIRKKKGEAMGVLIPIKDWKDLEPYVAKDSELYKLMSRLTRKSVFDMTDEEFMEHLRPTAEYAKQIDRDLGLPDIYKNESCLKDEEFIREYADGRKELVRLDAETRSFIVLKTY